MSDVAFKLYPADETATGGAYGTGTYGTSPYGGTQQGFKYVLPANEVPAGDPSDSYDWIVGETELRRADRLLGTRKFDEWRIWDFNFTLLETDDLDALLQFFRARRFKFLQDALEEETFVEVHWVGRQFQPRARRGGYYELAFAIEEIG